MTAPRLITRLAVLLAAATLMVARGAEQPDLRAALPVDPNVRIVELPNGLACWVRAHKTPPERVTLWLHVGTGSLNEEQGQRGLAHFLEHLAFDGTANFPPGELVKYFESIGLTFGRDQNAFTSYDQTTYTLTLPDTKDATLRKGLLCLADYAFRMSLLPEEIDKERKVVLEEVRARKGPDQRVREKLLPILLPGSRVAVRRPLGKEEVIRALRREDFLTYYGKWYRPGATTLLVVGDIEPDAVLKLIEEAFADWRPAARPPAAAEPGVEPYTETRAAVITDPELTEAEASAVLIRPLEPTETVGDFRRDLVSFLGMWAVDRRLEDMIRDGKAPFQKTTFWRGPLFNACTYVNTDVSGQPDKWRPMMESLLAEMKRARDHGILPRELEDAKKAHLAAAERAARTEPTRNARSLVSDMNRTVARGLKPISAAQKLELTQALLPAITLEEVSAAVRRNYSPDARLLLLTVPDKNGLPVPGEDEMLALAREVEARELEPWAAAERPEALLEKVPEPSTVARQEEDPDLKVLSVTLGNGVRAHLRSMDFKKDQVFVRITLAGGRVRETERNRGVTDVAALAFARPATGRLSSTDIRHIMIGKKIGVSGGAAGDHMWLRVAGSPDDLEDGMQLVHLLLTRPRIEKAALKQWKEKMDQVIEQRSTSVEAQLSERLTSLLTGGDPRVLPLGREHVQRLTLEDGQRWLEQVIASAPVEVSVVGDLDRARALELVLTYLGSLPPRPRVDPKLDRLRQVKQEDGPMVSTVEVDTVTPRAVVRIGWRGADWTDVKDRRTLSMASRILNSRLRVEIREERGLTYTIFCFARPGIEYGGTGIFTSHFTTDPGKAAEAAAITRQVMEKFAAEGPTAEEMATVLKQFHNLIETSQKEPGYWSEVLCDLDLHGTRLDDVKHALEQYTAYTREDLMAALAKYIVDKRRIEVISLPVGKDEVEAGEAEE